MLTQQPLTLALAATFFLSGSNGQALEESTTLPFALAVGKVLFTTPKPFIEISSTEQVYIRQGHALALADTQCLYTETPQVQLCFGHRWPTRVRLLPHGHLKIGLHSPGLSQLAYIHNPSFVTETLHPVANENVPSSSPRRRGSTAVVDSRLRGNDGSGIFRSATTLNLVARAIVTEILQGVKQQGGIIEQARQRGLMLSHLNNNSNNNSDRILFEEPLEGDTKEDDAAIEWWEVAQQPASDTNDSDMVQVSLDNNDILLKPDTRYCFTPGTETNAYRQTTPDESSGSEDNGSSDENSDSDPDEEDTEPNTEPDVEFIGTTADPFPVSKEIREYCAGLEQRKIKQEPTSDSEMPIGPEIEIAADSTDELSADSPSPATRKKSKYSGKKLHSCQECGRAFAQNDTLKKHLRTHSGEKPYSCQVCGRTFSDSSSRRKHLLIHSGEKPFLCQVCGRAFVQGGHLRAHLRTHTGEKPFLCQVCGKGFAQSSTMKRHLNTHSGKKPYPCQVCGKAFSWDGALKIHQRTHSGEKPYSCRKCGKAFTQSSHLKRHQHIHRTAEEPPT